MTLWTCIESHRSSFFMLSLMICSFSHQVPAGEDAPEKPVATQEQTVKDADVLEQIVVTATDQGRERWQVPAAMGVIDGQDIAHTSASHPSEIMGRVSGVWVNMTTGEGHMTAIRQPITVTPLYLFLENGIPTRSAGFFDPNALYELNLPMAGGIEVIKGPGSALHGSDAIGGVINVQTRPVPQRRELELDVEWGEHAWRRYLLTIGDRIGVNAYRLDMNQTESEGWREHTGYDRLSGTFQWERPAAGGSLRVLAAFSRVRQDTAGISPVSEEDYLARSTANYTPISERNVDSFRLSVAYQRPLGPNGSLSLTPFVRRNQRDLLPNWSLTYDPTFYATANDSAGMLARYRLDFEPMNTRFMVGVDVEHSPGSQEENRISVTREGRIFTAFQMEERLYDYDAVYTGAASYVSFETSPHPSLNLYAGARYDTMSYDYHTHLEPLSQGRWQRPEDARPHFDQLSPKLGLSWRVSPDVNVFAALRNAFRAPSQNQLFRSGSSSETLSLQPVKAQNVEFGIRGRLFDHLNLQLTAYRLVKRDDILNFDNPFTGLRTSVNAGRTSHRGIELDAAYATKTLSIWAVGSYAEHEYDDWDAGERVNYSGNGMEYAPRLIANAGVAYSPHWLRGLRVGARWSKLGSYWMDAANTFRYGGHDLMYLLGAYTFANDMELAIYIHNPGDKVYSERASYNAFRGKEYAPGQPRSFRIALKYQWGN